MEYLLFIIYLVLFAWLVTKIKFFRITGLSKSRIIILLLLKIMAGIFYGWIGTYYGGLAQMYDTWNYHELSIEEYQLLFKNPGKYMTNLFYNPYEHGMGRFFASSNSYWNDLKSNIFIKLLSVFNIFSFGNYYVNVIFYSFITLFGPIALFKIMADVFPGKKNTILLFTFLVPSFLFWTSGLGKEGILFTGISLLIYSVYYSIRANKWSTARIITIIVCSLIVLAMRNFVFVLLIPAILVWGIASKKPEKARLIFAVSYLVFIILFFTSRYISPRLDFPNSVANKQKEFLQIVGSSSVSINELEPTVSSYLKNSPQAISLSALRPYPGDVKHILSLAASIEIISILLLILLFIFYRKNGVENKPFFYFCLFFSLSMLLSIGFSQSNLGAIVRYRSIILPLYIVPIAGLTDWNRIKGIITKYI